MGLFWLVIGIFIGGSVGMILMAAACMASRADRMSMENIRMGIPELAEAANGLDNNNGRLRTMANMYPESVEASRLM